MKKIIRITTVPGSLRSLLRGQLKFMNQHYNVIGISGNGVDLDDVEQQEGIKTYGVKMTRTITPIKDLKALYKLYKIFKKEKPFIVHTHTPKAGTIGMLAAKLASVPHRLHTIAGLPLLEIKGAKRSLLNQVEKFTYACATQVLPNSYGLKEIIVNNKYAKSTKLKVIGNGSSNGIDTDYYDSEIVSEAEKIELRKKLDIKSSDIVFIFVGRIVKHKGITELVSAFNSLSKKYKHCKLLLIGSRENHLDPLSSITETFIKNNKRIIDIGYNEEIRPFVAISSVLAFPSYREGFPNVVLQASSMGLPCIVSDINGCNEIIKHNFNGIIVPPKNEIALEEAMEFMIINPEKREAMALHTRSRILQRYRQEYIWQELLNYYKDLE